VFLTGKKVAGILIDVVPGGRHIVGIGLNVNNPLAAAPEDVRGRATSLCEVVGHALDRTAVLLSLLENLEAAVRQSSTQPELIGRRFNELCLQHGRLLTIETGGQRTTGTCMGIAPDGALLLETAQGWQKFYSGVLIHDA
jgi:BirA family biotin operon repressor/biotin-[acetyl-CoA-carboxylase] ligase